MAREIKTTAIDGVQFKITQLGFKDGRQVLVRLAKLLGPSLVVLADKAPSLATLMKSRGLPEAISKTLAALDDADLEWLTSIVGKGAQFSTDGQRWPMLDDANREELFAGRITLWGKWLFWALGANFSDFSEALSALHGSGREGATQASSQASSKS